MIYRALVNLGLNNGTIKAGELFSSGRLKGGALAILEEQNKIAPASLPPIAAMPRWKAQRNALAKIGVNSAGDFLEMDDSALAKALKSSEANVKQWKAEMFAQFSSPKPKR